MVHDNAVKKRVRDLLILPTVLTVFPDVNVVLTANSVWSDLHPTRIRTIDQKGLYNHQLLQCLQAQIPTISCDVLRPTLRSFHT